MTTLENKRNDIITLAKGAAVNTYVPQIWKCREIYLWMKNIHVYVRLTICKICTAFK